MLKADYVSLTWTESLTLTFLWPAKLDYLASDTSSQQRISFCLFCATKHLNAVSPRQCECARYQIWSCAHHHALYLSAQVSVKSWLSDPEFWPWLASFFLLQSRWRSHTCFRPPQCAWLVSLSASQVSILSWQWHHQSDFRCLTSLTSLDDRSCLPSSQDD